MRKINYTSIDLFKSFYTRIKMNSEFVTELENGDKVFDTSKEKPITIAFGTVKTHGSNCSIVLSPANEFYCQSRKNVLTDENDKIKFKSFVTPNEDKFIELLKSVPRNKNEYVTIFGEFAGPGIHKGVAVNQLESKVFIVFGVKLSTNINDELESRWIPITDIGEYKDHSINCYNVLEFGTYNTTINFNDRYLNIMDRLNKLTLEVEKQCPIGKYFGIDGVGEGIVWYMYHKNTQVQFKVKGEKHARRIKKNKQQKRELTPDEIKLQSIKEKVSIEVTPEWRLSQGIDEIFEDGNLVKTKLGDYIKWVLTDIIKEDIVTLQEHNLTKFDISKYVSQIARQYFFDLVNNQ